MSCQNKTHLPTHTTLNNGASCVAQRSDIVKRILLAQMRPETWMVFEAVQNLSKNGVKPIGLYDLMKEVHRAYRETGLFKNNHRLTSFVRENPDKERYADKSPLDDDSNGNTLYLFLCGAHKRGVLEMIDGRYEEGLVATNRIKKDGTSVMRKAVQFIPLEAHLIDGTLMNDDDYRMLAEYADSQLHENATADLALSVAIKFGGTSKARKIVCDNSAKLAVEYAALVDKGWTAQTLMAVLQPPEIKKIDIGGKKHLEILADYGERVGFPHQNVLKRFCEENGYYLPEVT